MKGRERRLVSIYETRYRELMAAIRKAAEGVKVVEPFDEYNDAYDLLEGLRAQRDKAEAERDAFRADYAIMERKRDEAVAEAEAFLDARAEHVKERSRLTAERDAALSEVAKLREALVFYADPAAYIATGWQGDMDPSPVERDRGFAARAALTLKTEQPTAMDIDELRWFARQSKPIYGGHLKRGDPPDDDMKRWLDNGWIKQSGQGYVITDAGRAALEGRGAC